MCKFSSRKSEFWRQNGCIFKASTQIKLFHNYFLAKFYCVIFLFIFRLYVSVFIFCHYSVLFHFVWNIFFHRANFYHLNWLIIMGWRLQNQWIWGQFFSSLLFRKIHLVFFHNTQNLVILLPLYERLTAAGSYWFFHFYETAVVR